MASREIELSVIMPYCNEQPMVAFTVQSVIEELMGFCKFEIILVDNMSDAKIMCKAGDREYPIRSRDYFNGPKGPINTWFFRKGIIKNLIFDEKQGHWNAKNFGIKNSSGKYLMFLDAHCIMNRDGIRKMVEFLRENPDAGGVHPYINYMLDSRSLEYRVQAKFFGYQFCSAQPNKTEPYKVCVMSTCGMMSPRSVFDELGAWHPELGIYGGGESYINWKQSTCGYPHYIHPESKCWHYAEKRGYSWNHTDYVRNSFIAAYVVGGDKWLQQQVDLRIKKDRPEVIHKLADDVHEKCKEEREFIKGKQTITFDDYIKYWEENPGVWR